MKPSASTLVAGLLALSHLTGGTLAAWGQAPAPVSDVTAFGARGDGQNNDARAFRAALSSGAAKVRIPAGTYLLGPEPLDMPANLLLQGDGRATVLKPAPGTGVLFHLAAGTQIRDLAIDGSDVASGEVNDGLIEVRRADGCRVDSVYVTDCDRACVLADHGNDLLIRDCEFRRVGMGVSLTFSHRVKVIGNTVVDARVHGMQFWGNWQWETLDSADLLFANNYVKNGGGGAIWGAGGRRVALTGNIVDGASDVGLDLEWCQDSVISGNTVRNCENAGISLFFACKRISITGNTIVNDREVSEPDADWFVRAGIWLTPPNRETFKNDHGHEDVSIVGNTIFCAPPESAHRRAMWIGAEVKDVVIQGNAVSGGELLYGGHHKANPQRLTPIEQPVVLNDLPTPDAPAF